MVSIFVIVIVKSEVIKYFIRHDWIKTVIVKKDDDLLFVWQKV